MNSVRPSPPAERVGSWRSIKLGTHDDGEALRNELEAAGFRLSSRARYFLKNTEIAHSESSVNLVVLTPEALGFKWGSGHDALYARARGLGFELCPAEVGPQLRLQYLEQPYGEWLHVATGLEPLMDSEPAVIYGVRHADSGRWLDGGYSQPKHVWPPSSRWVFVQRGAEG